MNSMGSEPNEAIEEFREEWLSGYLDGELTSEQRAVVESRLQHDPDAQRLLAELQQARGWVQQLSGWDETLKPIDYCRSLASGTLADAARHDGAWNSQSSRKSEGLGGSSPAGSSRRPAAKQPPTWLRPLAIAASVLVIVGLGYGLYRENSPLWDMAHQASSERETPSEPSVMTGGERSAAASADSASLSDHQPAADEPPMEMPSGTAAPLEIASEETNRAKQAPEIAPMSDAAQLGLSQQLESEASGKRSRSEEGLGPGALSMRASRGAGGRTEAGAKADRFPPPPSTNLGTAQAAQSAADRGGERRPSEVELAALVHSKLQLMRSERLSDERAIASLALARNRIASSEASPSRSRDDDELDDELETFDTARSDVPAPSSDDSTQRGGGSSSTLNASDTGSDQPAAPVVYLLSFADSASTNAFKNWLSEAETFQRVSELVGDAESHDAGATRSFDAAEPTDDTAGVSTLSNGSAENRRSDEPAARPASGIGLLLTADEMVEIRRQFPALRLRAVPTSDPSRLLSEIPSDERLGRTDRELMLLIPLE